MVLQQMVWKGGGVCCYGTIVDGINGWWEVVYDAMVDGVDGWWEVVYGAMVDGVDGLCVLPVSLICIIQLEMR